MMDLKRLKMYSAQWLIYKYQSAIMVNQNPDEVNDLANELLRELAQVQQFQPEAEPKREFIGRVVDDGQLGLKIS